MTIARSRKVGATRHAKRSLTLQSKLLLAVVLPLVVALGAFGWLAMNRASESLLADFDAQLRQRALVVARAVHKADPWTMFFDFQEKREGARFREQARTLDGELAWRSFTTGQPLPFSEAAREMRPENRIILETVHDPDLGPLRVATAGVMKYVQRDADLHLVSYVQTALPLAAQDESARSLQRWLSIGGIAAAVLATLAAWLLLREWLGGFRALSASMRSLRMDPGGRERLPVSETTGEMAALARDFNVVLDRLETALAAQQRFSGDASHELRTPLAILRSEIELALRRVRTAEEYRDALQSCREESERLSRLVENLLCLARADAGEALAEREPVNLGALAGELCERFRVLADSLGVRLACEVTGECELPADGMAIERVLTNLIENALRHSPRGEAVEVRVAGKPEGVSIDIEDHGGGLPPEHLPRIFDRFYRVDKGRSRSRGGAGLGLSIVKSLVEAHGGRVSARSELGHGAVFSVFLPRPQEPRQNGGSFGSTGS